MLVADLPPPKGVPVQGSAARPARCAGEWRGARPATRQQGTEREEDGLTGGKEMEGKQRHKIQVLHSA